MHDRSKWRSHSKWKNAHVTVATKMHPEEVEEIDLLALEAGKSRYEFIRSQLQKILGLRTPGEETPAQPLDAPRLED
jgi:hypothetical protein